MNSSTSVLLPHGGYRQLRSYKIAEIVYDATIVFCDRFIDRKSRTYDQMVQAARSGVRNISEGSGAAATSRQGELFLTNVARASLIDELARDYVSFLDQRGMCLWGKNSSKCLAMRERLRHDVAPCLPPTDAGRVRLTGLLGLVEFARRAEAEIIANALICAIHQATYLLRRQMESQGRYFKANGGFKEHLHALRRQARKV